MEIRWLDDAFADLDAVYSYIAADNPEAAGRVVSHIREAVRALGAMPERGRPGRISGTRELVIPRMAYIVPYRKRGNAIEILRVFHGAQEWPDSFEKEPRS